MRVGQKIMMAGLAVLAVGSFARLATPASTPTAAPSTYVDPVTAPVDDPTPDAPVLSAEDAAKQNDKGWVLESYTGRNTAGYATTVARIKNANSTVQTATFTLTLLDHGSVVLTFEGSAQSIDPGATVTVQMPADRQIETAPKADDFQFQTDISYAG